MAFSDVVRELVIQVKFAVDSSAMVTAERTISKLHRRLDAMGNMGKIQQSIRGVTVSAQRLALGFGAMTAGLGVFLNEAGQANKTRIAFETMTGSAEKGLNLLAELHALAFKTPFSLRNVEDNAALLLGLGIETEKITGTMQRLGDVAAGINRPLGMIALNYGQIKTNTTLAGTELRDFGRQGVPILAELAKNLGKSTKQIREMVSKKLITFEQVEEAFKTMTAEGGRFFNLMEKQAKTFPGLMSNFLIFLQIIAREIGQKLLPTAKKYLKVLTEWIQLNRKIITSKFVDFFKGFMDILKKMAIFIKDMVPKLISLTDSLGGLGRIVKVVSLALLTMFGLQLANMIGSITAGIGLMVAAMLGMLPPAIAANVVFGFLPVLIGLAVIALGLLVDEFQSFVTGQESFIGDLVKRWSEWRNVIEDVLDLLIGLVPFSSLFQAKSKEATGKTLGGRAASTTLPDVGDISGLVRRFQDFSANAAIGVMFPSTQAAGKTTVTQDVKIEVNGAGDPEAVATNVVEKLTGNTYRNLMNNSSSSMATSPAGN